MSAVDRRLITHANWSLLGFTLLLVSVGLLNLYSASGIRIEDGIRMGPYFEQQIVWGAVGICCMFFCALFDYRHLKGLSIPIFIVSILLLAFVPIGGASVNGAKRWISLGFANVQPSEFAKISTLIMCATLLSRIRPPLGWREIITTLAIICIPCAFIFIQPDLGTTLNILLLICGVILYHGVKASVIKLCCVIIPASIPLAWFALKEYQKQRILTFLDPSRDAQGAGYHITQSQIAIGSGQLWGKGFLGGTQSLLRFLPEKHTDFAIAVFSEEWGYVGCVLLMTLFCLFLICIIRTARNAKDLFGSLLCVGVFFYFFWQILINIGMVVGMMPVVGIPLPFISYGGTAMIVNFILVGLVLNVSMRRFIFKSN